jgi:hypothetical protein
MEYSVARWVQSVGSHIVHRQHSMWSKKSHSTTVQAQESLVMKFDAINVIIEESRNIVQS